MELQLPKHIPASWPKSFQGQKNKISNPLFFIFAKKVLRHNAIAHHHYRPPQIFHPFLGLKPQPAHKNLASGVSEYQIPLTALGGLLPEQITLTMQRNVYMALNTRLSWDQNKGKGNLATSLSLLPTGQVSGPYHELGTIEFHSLLQTIKDREVPITAGIYSQRNIL